MKNATIIDTETVRRYYRRLNHQSYGVTELAVIKPGHGIIATGFFNNENDFVKACQGYNGRYNVYAGRNPRPPWLPKVCENYLDTKQKQRARDCDIEYVTAVSLDIDPARPKGTSSTEEQHKAAINFAIMLHDDTGGWVDDSGNGAYLWTPFKTPIRLSGENRELIKKKCKAWQEGIIKKHQSKKSGLKIDGCYDLSRLKKVIGTMSVKGQTHRLSRFVKTDNANDRVRNAILSIQAQPDHENPISIKPCPHLPSEFLELLRTNKNVQELWLTPNEQQDTSMHDWMLGNELIKAGITHPQELARVLMLNPFGKYQRDRRYDYVRTTVNKLKGDTSGT